MKNERNPWAKYSPVLAEERRHYMENAATAIKNAKNACGKSQSELAKSLEISRSEYSHYENAKVDMPYSNLPLILKLCEANTYDVMRDLIPEAKTEFEYCRDKLLEIMIENDMDASVLNPLYPVGYDITKESEIINFKSFSYQSPVGNDVSLFHDDPTITATDLLSMAEFVVDEDQRDMFQQSLLKCVLLYWKTSSRLSAYLDLLAEHKKNRQADETPDKYITGGA